MWTLITLDGKENMFFFKLEPGPARLFLQGIDTREIMQNMRF